GSSSARRGRPAPWTSRWGWCPNRPPGPALREHRADVRRPAHSGRGVAEFRVYSGAEITAERGAARRPQPPRTHPTRRPAPRDRGEMSSSQQPFRLAVIGSGPAGVYAAETLLKTKQVKNGELEVSIDLFDRFPTPFGLIRYGVAPDHPRIKGIITALHRLFATGALKDADLAIPGIELDGSHGAADFVAWYDGNPDYPRTWELDAEAVAVIGNGNVALDVARVLSKSADELLRTEIPDNVHEGLQAAATTDVHIFGRRGPAQTKFSPLEARELAHPKGLQVVMDPRDLEQITEAEWEAINADRRTSQVVQTFVGWLEEQQRREAAGEEPTDREGGPVRRRLHMHFWHRPVEV